MSSLTPEQTETLIDTILSGPSIERPSALFNLVKAIADPNGDRDRYDCALSAMRVVDPLTQEYEAWFQGRVATAVSAVERQTTN